MERRQSRSITLAPSVYDPRNPGAAGANRPKRSKDLPPIPKSPWPVPPGRAARTEDAHRTPRRTRDARLRDQHESGRTHSEPPSRQGSFYTDAGEPDRRARSNPPSRKGTVAAAPPRRPTIVQDSLPPRRSSEPPSTPPPAAAESKQPPSSPPSRSSTLVASPPLPSFNPAARGNSFQTRYMSMLLSLDKIPRLHNILASFFGWVLLAGFIVLPGTFTSLAKLQNNDVVANTPGAADVLDTVASLPLLVVAAACCGVGYAGNLWLSVRWRLNYVWLINRLYMPGVLNALAGLVSTLTNIYAQHKGSWSVSAKVAVVVEAVTLVLYLVLFVLYNNWLLEKVKEQHELEFRGAAVDSRTFKGRVEKMAKQPAVAPGSIV